MPEVAGTPLHPLYMAMQPVLMPSSASGPLAVTFVPHFLLPALMQHAGLQPPSLQPSCQPPRALASASSIAPEQPVSRAASPGTGSPPPGPAAPHPAATQPQAQHKQPPPRDCLPPPPPRPPQTGFPSRGSNSSTCSTATAAPVPWPPVVMEGPSSPCEPDAQPLSLLADVAAAVHDQEHVHAARLQPAAPSGVDFRGAWLNPEQAKLSVQQPCQSGWHALGRPGLPGSDPDRRTAFTAWAPSQRPRLAAPQSTHVTSSALPSDRTRPDRSSQPIARSSQSSQAYPVRFDAGGVEAGSPVSSLAQDVSLPCKRHKASCSELCRIQVGGSRLDSSAR